MKKIFLGVICSILLFPVLVMAEETLVAGDKIHVWVLGEPDLTMDCIIGSDGSIPFPLVGSVGVAGMNPRDAAKLLAKMLDDGFIRNPMVQITCLSPQKQPQLQPILPPKMASSSLIVEGRPLVPSAKNFPPKALEQPKLPLKIIDEKTGMAISKAFMLLGGKIYQTNPPGELLIDAHKGNMVLMADGYQILQGPIETFLKQGSVKKIMMSPLALAQEIRVKVIDAKTQSPLSNATIKLNQMRVKTNSHGLFRISLIVTEFGEIEISKKGYKAVKKILDFKDSSERLIALIPND